MSYACDLTPTPLLKERGFEFAVLPLSFRRGVGVRSQAAIVPDRRFS